MPNRWEMACCVRGYQVYKNIWATAIEKAIPRSSYPSKMALLVVACEFYIEDFAQ